MPLQTLTTGRFGLVLFLCCLVAGATAALRAAAGTAMAQGQDRPAGAAEIQPGELLVISLDGLMGVGQETRLTRRVGEEGEIWLPLLDEQPLSTRQLTPG